MNKLYARDQLCIELSSVEVDTESAAKFTIMSTEHILAFI